jgi:hypothetical protein
MSKLTYQNDIASRPYSRILSFKSSPYKIYVEKDKNGFYQIHAKDSRVLDPIAANL